ncbi:MAG: hypothetical protein JXR95_02820 [Deltaproteobacteria bacterium]|nr:hypothetical protein [Deltaproteobacteria bacterium]
MKNIYFALMLSVLFSIGCSPKTEEKKSGTKQGNSSQRIPPKTVRPKVTRYAFLTEDIFHRPLGFLENPKGPFKFTFADNNVIRVEKLDTQGTPFEHWDITYGKGKIPESIRHFEESDHSSRTVYKTTPKKVCMEKWDLRGNLEGTTCITSTGKNKYSAEENDIFGNLTAKSVITVDNNNIPVKIQEWNRFGEYTGQTFLELKVSENKIHKVEKKTSPDNFPEFHRKSVYNEKGQIVSQSEFWADGSLSTSTTFKWLTPWKVNGTSITKEGNKISFESTVDKMGHRLKEVRKSGNRTIETERSRYDESGKLVYRERQNDNGALIYREKRSYNQKGILDFIELYRGNLHELECTATDDEIRSDQELKTALVKTKLPALEKSKVTYDSLSRVVSIKRYYMEELLDTEKISYTSKGQIASKELILKNSPDPSRVEYEYDSRGNTTLEKIIKGKYVTEMIKYTWSPKNLLVKKELLDGTGTPPLKSKWPDGSIVKYQYDKRGRLIKEEWFHADGTRALSRLSKGCTSCSTASTSGTIHKILRTYDTAGKLLTVSEQNENSIPIYESSWTYTISGLQKSFIQSWPLEKKVKSLVTSYSDAGWKMSADASTSINGKIVYREIRKFDSHNLLTIEKYKNGKMISSVQRKFTDGYMVKRTVTDSEGKTTEIDISRDSNGLVVSEKAHTKDNKPALAKDIWNNKYSDLFIVRNNNFQVERITLVNALDKSTTKSVFSYNDKNQKTGRKVFLNNKLQLEVTEHFSNSFLAEFNISSGQTRTAIIKGKRNVSSYQILLNKENIKKTTATITLSGKKQHKLSGCSCKGCGVTINRSFF